MGKTMIDHWERQTVEETLEREIILSNLRQLRETLYYLCDFHPDKFSLSDKEMLEQVQREIRRIEND